MRIFHLNAENRALRRENNVYKWTLEQKNEIIRRCEERSGILWAEVRKLQDENKKLKEENSKLLAHLKYRIEQKASSSVIVDNVNGRFKVKFDGYTTGWINL